MLRAEHREQLAYPPLPAFGERILRQRFGEQARHRIEVERVAVTGADGCLQVRRAAARLGAFEVRLENVRELEHQPVEVLAESFGFVLLHRSPGMAQQARRHRGVAVRHLAVDLDRGAGAPQAVLERFVRALRQPARRLVPKRGERRGVAACGERADFLLQPQGMLSDALTVAAARGDAECAVDEARQRPHEQVIDAIGHQHQWKIVA